MDKNIIKKSVYMWICYQHGENCKSKKINCTCSIPLFIIIRPFFGSSNHTQCNTQGNALNHVTQHGVHRKSWGNGRELQVHKIKSWNNRNRQ